MSATSCLQHKALGQFFGLYPQNVQLNYDLSNFKDQGQVATPVLGNAQPSDEDIVRSLDINRWWVYAYPKSGNPDRKIYEFPFDDWDEEAGQYIEHPENMTGAFLPIFSEGDFEHFRGLYDFVVCSDPLHNDPMRQIFSIATGKSFETLETNEPRTVTQFDCFNTGGTEMFTLATDMPVSNGFPYTDDPSYCRLFYGTLKNELVQGSSEENTTHEADVLIKGLESYYEGIEIPSINLVSREICRFTETNSTCIVTGLTETWKIGMDKPGDKAFNIIGHAWGGGNYNETFSFSHMGKSPAADKVELYVITAVLKELQADPTKIDYETYLFYRRYDITDKIGKDATIELGEDFEWTPDFTGKLPSSKGNYNWYEITK